MKVIKRNGAEVEFDIVKIIAAVTKANEVVDEADAKIKALSLPPGVSARAALVYDGGLSPVVAAALAGLCMLFR